MEFNLARVHEAIAAAIPDRECIVFRDRRLSWADVTDRTRRLANVLGDAGSALAQKGGRTRRPRITRRPSRHLLLQRQRVPRGDDRRVQGAPRPGERQLPLRRRGAALPPRQQPGQGDRVPLAVRADVGRGAPRPAAAHGVAPGGRRVRQRPATRRALVRRSARGRIARSARVCGTVVARRLVHPLHRRNDRHAEGRAVASARHLPLGHGRCRRRNAPRVARGGGRGGQGWLDARDARGPVHARRRATGSRCSR